MKCKEYRFSIIELVCAFGETTISSGQVYQVGLHVRTKINLNGLFIAFPFYVLKWYYKTTLLIHISQWLIRSHSSYKTLLKNQQTFWVDRKFRKPTLLSAIIALEFCRLKKHKWAGFEVSKGSRNMSEGLNHVQK